MYQDDRFYNLVRGTIQKQINILKSYIPEIRKTDPEVEANTILAIRHLEDARMRLGKAIQYAGDGVSCYDKQKYGNINAEACKKNSHSKE